MKRGILLTALSGILYGSIGYFGSTLMANGLTLYEMLMWRFLASTVCLIPVLPFICSYSDIRKHSLALLQLVGLGIIFYGAGTGFYFAAGQSIGTGLAMVIFFTYPIFVVGMSGFSEKKRPSQWVILALLMIVLGCALIAFGSHGDAKLELFGIGLAFISGMSYGSYILTSKKASRQISPILSTFAVCVGSTITFLPNIYMSGNFYWPATSDIWLLITLFGSIGTALPVLLLLAGMKRISATQASIISVLEPVTVLAVGAMVLGELVTTLQVIGAVTILASAIVVQLDRS